MNKELRELLAKYDSKMAMAKSFMEEGENKDLEKASKLMDEADEIKKEFDVKKRLCDKEKEENTPSYEEFMQNKEKKAKKDDTEEFVKGIKEIVRARGMVSNMKANVMTETSNEDGGFTVPEDISTKVERYKDVEYSLLQDIDIVPVATRTGARTFMKKGEVNTLVDLSEENEEITKQLDAMKFERLPYSIKDRAGFLPVSNNLVDDSDANILALVTEWLGKINVATSNKLILAKVAEKEEVDLVDIDGIKKAVNVTLGQAYKAGAKIYTNDDGLQYLDTLKDKNGRALLNPDPTAPANMQLRCGTTVLDIKVLPNKVFKTDSIKNKVPFIVGNLFDYVRKYDRKSMSIMASNTATIGTFNAFAQNMTVLRAIVRDDYTIKDKDSIVNGYIKVAMDI